MHELLKVLNEPWLASDVPVWTLAAGPADFQLASRREPNRGRREGAVQISRGRVLPSRQFPDAHEHRRQRGNLADAPQALESPPRPFRHAAFGVDHSPGASSSGSPPAETNRCAEAAA